MKAGLWGNVDLLKGTFRAMLTFPRTGALLYMEHRSLLIGKVLVLSPKQGPRGSYLLSQMPLPRRWGH